jgi:hypothetical protein
VTPEFHLAQCILDKVLNITVLGSTIMGWGGDISIRAWLCVSLIAAALIAGLVTSWNPITARKPDPAATIVALRFPRVNPITTTEERLKDALFFGQSPLADPGSSPAAFMQSEPGYVFTASLHDNAALDSLPRAGRPPEPTSPPNARDGVFNDAQLASIKARLRLTADQQPLWEPVEAALRAIRWSHVGKSSARSEHSGRVLDPDAETLSRLKNVARPLLITFRPDQKDEVRALARLMGLEQIASQF